MKPTLEALEARTLPALSVSLANGVLFIAATQSSFTVLSQPTVTTVEVFDALTNQKSDYLGVTQISFTGGKGETAFYNNTNIPSTQVANNNKGRTAVLVGGSNNDTLIGGNGDVYESDPGGNNTLIGGNSLSNLFAGPGNNKITGGSGTNRIYDILGQDTIDGGSGPGYLLVNAQSQVVANKSEQVVTFFQPLFTSVNTPFFLQPDVNGNGILYLLPQNPTNLTSIVINQTGPNLTVNYKDIAGNQSFIIPKSQVSWLAYFGGSGGTQITNNTNVNNVFYGGKGNDIIVGGFGLNVLKGHSGQDIIVGRGFYNDLSVGTGSPSTIYGFQNNVYRNVNNTIDYNVSFRDIVIGVPSLIDRQTISRNNPALNADYYALEDYLTRYQIQRFDV